MQHLLISAGNKLQKIQEDSLLTCNCTSLKVVSYQDADCWGMWPLIRASRTLKISGRLWDLPPPLPLTLYIHLKL